MSLSQFLLTNINSPDVFHWFRDIYNHLSAKNYSAGAWTPVMSGVTGYHTHSPSSMTVAAGTLVSGTVADLAADDGNLVTIQETAPFSVELIFTGVVSADMKLKVKGNYNGNPAHNVKLQIYNGTGWDNVTANTTDFPSTATETLYEFVLPSYVTTGQVRVRILHTSSAVSTHYLYLDFVGLNVYHFSAGELTAWYHRWGQLMTFEMMITGGIVFAGATVSGLPYRSLMHGSGHVIDATSLAYIAPCVVRDGVIYLPDLSISNSDIIISGSYKTSGI